MVKLPRKIQTEVNRYGRDVTRNIVDIVPFVWKYQEPSDIYTAERFGWRPESTGNLLDSRIRNDASKILGKPVREIENSALFRRTCNALEDKYWGALQEIPHSLLFIKNKVLGISTVHIIYSRDQPIFEFQYNERDAVTVRTYPENEPVTPEQLERIKSSFFRLKRAILKHPKTQEQTISMQIFEHVGGYLRGLGKGKKK